MKKAISLLLTLMLSLAMGVVAFAAEDIPGEYNYLPEQSRLLGAIRTPATQAGNPDTIDVTAKELFLAANGKVVGTDTVLLPNETYKFDIYYASSAITAKTEAEIFATAAPLAKKLTKADIGKGYVKLRTVKGSSAILSAKIKTVGTGATQTFRLDIETRANYGTKQIDVEYLLSIIDNDTANTFADSNHTFIVGYGQISDSETDVGEEGTLTITNETPVILKEQFTDIAKSANYKNVTFEAEDGNWTFKGKVAGMKDTNFSYNYDPNTDLLNKFPEQEFKFVNFPAGVNFPTTGEMRIDVSDVSDAFGSMYAYLYRDGKLTEINTTYDSGADQLVFRTNYLGNFIITNREITDTSLIGEEEPEEEEEPIIIPEDDTNNNNNPSTGSATALPSAAFGLIALASAGVVASRKRKV